MGDDRGRRSRGRGYLKQLSALGLGRWLTFKYRRLQSRSAPRGKPFWVTTPLARYPLGFRAHTSDALVFGQIFIGREYRCLDDVADADFIVDAGANVGYSSAYFLSRYPNAHVVAIEPDPENFAMLEKNLAPYGDRCTLVQGALWSSSSGVVIAPPREGEQLEWAVRVRSAEAGEEVTVPTVDVASLLRDTGRERISILKVDIEGSEQEVFAEDSDARTWLDRVDNLVIEIHGAKCRKVFTAAIDGFGFELSTCDELTVCLQPATASGS